MSQEPPIGQGPAQPVQAQTGVVTLLFTDIVSSTALKQRLGDKAGSALIQQHRALVRQLLAACPGAEEIETAGDSFLLSFPKPSDAVRFALVLQGRLRALNQGQPVPLQDRIGIDLGEVVIEQHAAGHKPKDLYGLQIDTCARVMSLAKVVLYQLLISDFRRPLTTDWARAIDDDLLRVDLEHGFSWNPAERFGGAVQLARQLRGLSDRRAALTHQQTALEQAA